MALNDIAFPDGVTQAPRWDKCIHPFAQGFA